jgi:U3 small nucleolar ribonucleoprotein protein IMP3
VRTIEQGHIRVGTQPVTDPAMLIPRRMEDFVTWVDTSARKRTIMKYNDEVSCLLARSSHHAAPR